MATYLVGATGNIGKRVVEKGGDKINVISRFELKLDQRPLYYNFDAKTIGGTSITEGDVIIFAAAALLTPPDPVTQIGLAIPLLLLYELSIISVKFIEKKNKEKNAQH